jgi:hypothetical protein
MSGFQRSFLRTSGALLRRGFASETKAAHPPLTALIRQSQLIGSRPSRKIREGIIYNYRCDYCDCAVLIVRIHFVLREKSARRSLRSR